MEEEIKLIREGLEKVKSGETKRVDYYSNKSYKRASCKNCLEKY